MKGLFLRFGRMSIITLFLANAVFAQNETVFNKESVRKFPSHTEVTTFHDKQKRFATVQIMDKKGSLISETFYRDGLRHGTAKGYYTTGEPYWKADYKDDYLFGPFMVWYEDGGIKRKEFYKNNIRKKAECFDANGEVIPFFEYQTAPKYPGGISALQTFLRKNWPKNITSTAINAAVYLTVNLVVTTDSAAIVKSYSTYHSEENEYRRALGVIIAKMPPWIPGTLDGKASNETYSIHVIIRGSQLYLSEFYREIPVSTNQRR